MIDVLIALLFGIGGFFVESVILGAQILIGLLFIFVILPAVVATPLFLLELFHEFGIPAIDRQTERLNDYADRKAAEEN